MHIRLTAAALVFFSTGCAIADSWYEGRWTVEGTACNAETRSGISIYGDDVIFYSPSGGRYSMGIVGDQTEADFASHTEQSATITSREATEIGYSFLATMDHDGAEAGFAMLQWPLMKTTLVVQTGFFRIVRCE